MATFVLVFGGGSAWGGILILASVSCFVYCIGSISCAWNGALFWDLSTTPKIRSNGSTVESFVVHLRCGGLICNLELTQDQRETLIYQLRLES